ncbi:helix-turn-helix transcriptional regulator [Streptomyces canus]|uniref:helix-turn-helix transcriptional regulator n=1 Tax=Streptomyces canus TaxID=58343 RepID=UPI000998AD3B|nr:helix-turn-helix transcriptional regulator [Streptomyces canus]
MAKNEELGDFLRARRASIAPETIGVFDEQKRRVPGLRREELARLSGLSVDYYTRLEQGRPIEPSETVLDALATALGLDPTERSYLHTVARRPATTGTRGRSPRSSQAVRPGLFALMEAFGDVPVYILGRQTNVLASNNLARLLLTDFNRMPARERNAIRWVVLDEAARSLFGDGWEQAVAELTGALRMDAARHPDDHKTAELVGELSIKSETFRKWWAMRKVVNLGKGSKVLQHPLVGEVTLRPCLMW